MPSDGCTICWHSSWDHWPACRLPGCRCPRFTEPGELLHITELDLECPACGSAPLKLYVLQLGKLASVDGPTIRVRLLGIAWCTHGGCTWSDQVAV